MTSNYNEKEKRSTKISLPEVPEDELEFLDLCHVIGLQSFEAQESKPTFEAMDMTPQQDPHQYWESGATYSNVESQ